MTDRYEQFKEWFKHHPTDEDELDLVFAIGNLFKEIMTEKKRYDWDLNGIWDYNGKSDDYIVGYNNICDLLNQKEERITELENEKIKLEICLRQDNEQLKKEIKYLQSELHNIKKKTLNEVKLEIEKLERW